MATLGIIKELAAEHGTRNVRKSDFKVEVLFEGNIINDFVAGIDYDHLASVIDNVVKDIDGKYLDDIVGRATNENIALYLAYQLRELPFSSIKLFEDGMYFVDLPKSEVDMENYPSLLDFSRGKSLLMRERPKDAIEELNSAIKKFYL